MSALDRLQRLIATEDNDGLLPSCRLALGGAEIYGAQAIRRAFQAAKLASKGPLLKLASPQTAVIAAGDWALFADCYEGNIGRLWVVGDMAELPAEPAISVPFDPDLAQEASEFAFEPSDHPSLNAAGADRLVATLDNLGRDDDLRCRHFVLRAFGNGDEGGALIGQFIQSSEPVRRVGFRHVVLLWQGSKAVVRVDPPIYPPWRPRV